MAIYNRCDRCGETDEHSSAADVRTVECLTKNSIKSSADWNELNFVKDLCKPCRIALREFLKPQKKTGREA